MGLDAPDATHLLADAQTRFRERRGIIYVLK
jgi:hypothetical protein